MPAASSAARATRSRAASTASASSVVNALLRAPRRHRAARRQGVPPGVSRAGEPQGRHRDRRRGRGHRYGDPLPAPTRRSSRSSTSTWTPSSSGSARSAFLTKGLHIKLTDERADGKTVEFHYEGGIKDFVSYINEAKDAIHKHIVYFEGETDQGAVEVAMQWNNSYQESVFTFANNINHDRGRLAPLRVPERAPRRRSNRKAVDMKLLKKDEKLEGGGRARGSRSRRLRQASQTRSSRGRRRRSSVTPASRVSCRQP